MPTILARRITSLTDARYFAALEVHYLAFNLEPNTPGYLDPVLMQALREWVEGPKVTGEFTLATHATTVAEAAAFYHLDAVLVPAEMPLGPLLDAGVEVLVKMPADYTAVRNFSVQNAAFRGTLVLELPADATDWHDALDWLPEVSSVHPVLLQWTGTAAEVPSLLQKSGAAGLSLTGGDEEQVGVKSFDDLNEVFDVIADS
jgi:phosphoribosylanthranilate isomerase